jgi:predicted nucleic acid-binding protein
MFTNVAALVDTNVLVYRFDSRFTEKQKIATGILRRGIAEDSIRLPHQAIVEFVAAVTRPIRGHIILKQSRRTAGGGGISEAVHRSLSE